MSTVIEDKLPFFIIKLWNILEDESLADIVRWDESGQSFHILHTFDFTRHVLPNYFKHKNLNSFVRQLNLYGFRKISSLDRSCLVYSVDTPDDLHFSHPYFLKDHPELLYEIRRNCNNTTTKQLLYEIRRNCNNTTTKRQAQAQKPVIEEKTILVAENDLISVLNEINSLRERMNFYEDTVFELARENELLWEELEIIRTAHNKQQQSVNKLVQFLVSLLQPQKRMGKRIFPLNDEFESRGNNPLVATTNLQSKHNREILDCIQREMSEGQFLKAPQMTSKLIARSPGSLLQRLMSHHQLSKSSNLQDNGTIVIQNTGQTRPVQQQNVMNLKSSASSQNLAVQTIQGSSKSLVPVYSNQKLTMSANRPENTSFEVSRPIKRFTTQTPFHSEPSTSQQHATDLALAHHDYTMQIPPSLNLDHEFGLNQDFSLLEDPNFGNEEEWNDEEHLGFFDYGSNSVHSVHPPNDGNFTIQNQGGGQHYGIQMSPGTMTMEMSPQMGNF
uniref:HSF-type DNA-binding domain-containing protein n=1 Tax=Acrobeloides nanus TaxID=290746 RepID=A0A914D0G8_9BILA